MRLSWLEVQNINKRDRSVRKEKYLKRIKFGDNEKDSHIVGGVGKPMSRQLAKKSVRIVCPY